MNKIFAFIESLFFEISIFFEKLTHYSPSSVEVFKKPGSRKRRAARSAFPGMFFRG
jgi:hypothetical protein